MSLRGARRGPVAIALAILAMSCVPGGNGGGDADRVVAFSGYHPCITEISVSVKQGHRSSSRTITLEQGTGRASFGSWIDWSAPVEIAVRVLRSADCPEPRLFEQSERGIVAEEGGGLTVHPPDCGLKAEVRDKNTMATHDGNRFTDYSEVESPPGSGTMHPFNPFLRPSAADHLGHTAGVYLDGTTNLGKGYYKKIELDITTTAPCRIAGVSRSMETLPDHNVTPSHGNRPDPPDFNRSRPVHEDQHWVITDAPGFWADQITARKIYDKRFHVTISLESGGETSTYQLDYEARVEVDAMGGLVHPE